MINKIQNRNELKNFFYLENEDSLTISKRIEI